MLWPITLLLLCFLQMASLEIRQNATTNGNVDDDDSREYDDKILRIWIEHILKKYKKSIQSSTELKNIQRISKKGRTSSTSTTPIIENNNIEPSPVYPILFRPHYHQNMYSNYIPLPYGVNKHQISIPQENYPHRFFIPLHTQFPYGYTHIPSSTPINYDSKIIQTYHIPQNIQNETFTYNSMKNILNPSTNQYTLPLNLNIDDPIQEVHNNNEESGKPARDKKLLDSLDNTPNPIATETIQLNNSSKVQQSLSTTVNNLDTYTSSDKINFPDINRITSTPIPIISMDTSSSSEIFNDSVTHISFNTNNHLSEKLSSKLPYWSSVTGRSVSNNDENPIFKANKESSELEKDHNYLKSLNNTETTTESVYTLKTSMIKNEGKPMTINKITPAPQVLITLFSVTNTSSNEKTLYTNSYNNSIQMRSAYSTIQPSNLTNFNNESNNQSNFISLSTARPSPTSTTVFETTSLHKTSQTYNVPLIQQLPINPNQSSDSKFKISKSNTPQPTININKISLLPLLDSLSGKNTTNSISIETETNPTPSITTNVYNYKTKIKQNTITPIYSESPISSLTNMISIRPSHESINQDPIAKSTQNILPYSLNMNPLSKRYLNHTTTEKSNTHNEENTDHYFPVTTKETKRNSLKSTMMPIKTHNNIEKTSSHVTVSDDLKYKKSTNNQNRYTEKSMYTPNTFKESELWYNSMHNENNKKKELNEEQINYLLQKLIKLLKPEIEKQAITQESVARFVAPKLGDQEKLVYIILPWIRDAAKNKENEERKERKANSLKTSDKI